MNDLTHASSYPSSPIPVDQAKIEQRVRQLSEYKFSSSQKKSAFITILGLIDLTTLSGTDTTERVRLLCEKARNLNSIDASYPTVAAVCVFPNFVAFVRQELEGSGISVASVAAAFPSGQTDLSIKKMEVQYAIDQGANEIDITISRGKYLSGEYAFVYDEIASIKEVCRSVLLKVILETGELESLAQVRHASEIAIAAGADFIKTSTGKISPAATLPATLVMSQVIRDHFDQTGQRIGIKPAGGISSADDALQYFVLIQETLGADWLDKQWVRFGASSLVDSILDTVSRLNENSA